MNLNKDDLQVLCNVAKSAALAAGKIIAEARPESIDVMTKEGGENLASCVVTEVDLAAEKSILEILNPTIEEFDLGMLAEESGDNHSRFEKDYFWCIDPLDGTLAFSRGEDGYSTSIALVSKSGEGIIGVVNNPRSKVLYSAIRGQGAFKNDEALQLRVGANHCTLLFDQSFMQHPDIKSILSSLEEKLKEHGLDRIEQHPLGGAVMNGISTIEFAPAVYYKYPKNADGGGSLWDFAASSVIQSEAGGFNSDFFQNPLDLNRGDSTFMNHKGVIFCSSESLLSLIS